MHFDVKLRTIFRCRHGSHAYGLNVPTSDEDFKGVCIPPAECFFGFTKQFEQMEHMGSKSDGVDEVVYALRKFASLAADANPNIIEVLFVDDSDVILCDAYGQRLRDMRDTFISKRARHTFAGYACAQLHRIKTHRKWLLDPPKSVPSRKDFGLSEATKVSKSELGAYDSLLAQEIEVELPKDVITLFTREKAYQAAKTHYDQYVNWTKTRNPARAEFEKNFGYDVKHAMHLVRLMRMCKEILTTGEVIVKRPDREELLTIRRGEWTYDQVVECAEKFDAECEELYKTSTLPKEPNRAKIDELIVELTSEYLKLHG